MTRHSRFHRTAAALSALVVIAASAASALAATPDPTISPAWPLDTTLGYAWVSSAMPPDAMRTAIGYGAGDVNSSRASRAPSFVNKSGGNGISYGTSVPCGTNGLACFQRNPTGGYWHLWYRENGHRFDWGTLSWCEMSNSPMGCYQAETITIDELGHVAGLDHHVNLPDGSDYLDAVVQTFSHARPQVGWSVSALGRCDIATLQQVYGLPSWTTLYSTCLDIPTTLTLSVSPTASTPSTPVTFTATLRSAGKEALASNPMAARVVVLQQRSGTSWSDLVTMSGGLAPGVYNATLALKATQDFRAVFRKPANEGVRTSVSGSVTVTVTCTRPPCPVAPGQVEG